MPRPKGDPPREVAAIRAALKQFLSSKHSNGRSIGSAKYGIYVFYDYDGEPIYVGQTYEKLSGRISRHLTNQRTDAVAMNVLDPFEVADIEVWPLFDLERQKKDARIVLNCAEYSVFQHVLKQSQLGKVLNEKDIACARVIKLPQSFRGRIVPDSIYTDRKHPDVRIARRASTIANLARVISERNVSKGLRRTLVTQAQRLELLANRRFDEIGGEIPVEGPDEQTGDDNDEDSEANA